MNDFEDGKKNFGQKIFELKGRFFSVFLSFWERQTEGEDD